MTFFNIKNMVLSLIVIAFNSVASDQEKQLTSSSQHLLKSLEVDIKQTLIMLEESELKKGNSLDDFRYHAVLPQSMQSDLGLILEKINDADFFRVLAISPMGIATKLNVKANDLISAVNDIKINQENSQNLFNQLQQNSLEPVATINVLRNGRDIKVNIPTSKKVVPKIRLTIGEVLQPLVLTASTDEILAGYQVRECGVISVLATPPADRNIYPAIIQKVDNNVSVRERTRLQLPVGEHRISVYENLDVGFLSTKRSSNKTAKSFILNVQPNTIYYIGAKFIKENRHKVSGSDHWNPVIWKTKKLTMECNQS